MRAIGLPSVNVDFASEPVATATYRGADLAQIC